MSTNFLIISCWVAIGIMKGKIFCGVEVPMYSFVAEIFVTTVQHAISLFSLRCVGCYLPEVHRALTYSFRDRCWNLSRKWLFVGGAGTKGCQFLRRRGCERQPPHRIPSIYARQKLGQYVNTRESIKHIQSLSYQLNIRYIFTSYFEAYSFALKLQIVL